jgi:Zn-finger nucleic acid-binding protein
MNADLVDGLNLDVCPNCHGVWFDMNELQSIMHSSSPDAYELETAPKIEQRAVGESMRLCPGCDVRLNEYRYMYNSPVHLFGCEKCGGTWVPSGELAQMKHWQDLVSQPASPQEEAGIALGALSGQAAESDAWHGSFRGFTDTLKRTDFGWTGWAI